MNDSTNPTANPTLAAMNADNPQGGNGQLEQGIMSGASDQAGDPTAQGDKHTQQAGGIDMTRAVGDDVTATGVGQPT